VSAEPGRPVSRPLDVPPPRDRALAGSALITAVAQLTVMAVGGLLAIVILWKFGKNKETDGLFAAYGVYGVVLTVAQSFRTTIVARLVEGESLAANLDRYLGVALVLFAAIALPFLVLAHPFAELLTGGLGERAVDSADEALAILWLAAGAQIMAALVASALAVHDEFAVPAAAYAGSSVVGLVLLVALAGPLGITAVPVALAAAAFLAAAIMLVRLLRTGYRPSAPRLVAGARSFGAMRSLLVASAGPMAGQMAYLVSLAAAARLGEGSVTLFAYAFFAALLLVGATSGPIGIVMAAPLSETWDRRPASLEPSLVAVLRAGFLIMTPALAIVAVAGRDAVALVAGSRLSSGDEAAVVTTLLGLTGVLIATVAQTVPILAAYAAGRYARVAWALGAIVAVQAGSAAIAVQIGDLLALAIAGSATAVVSMTLLTAVVYGRETPRALRIVAREVGLVAAPAIVAFAPLGLALHGTGAGGRAAAAVVGLAVFAALVAWRLPGHRRLAVDALTAIRLRRTLPAENA
jgi:peptidoglycan biosynthesis protein MviN/MurJ (putative lipid II flippase)